MQSIFRLSMPSVISKRQKDHLSMYCTFIEPMVWNSVVEDLLQFFSNFYFFVPFLRSPFLPLGLLFSLNLSSPVSAQNFWIQSISISVKFLPNKQRRHWKDLYNILDWFYHITVSNSVLPEKKLLGLSPDFHIHVSVSDLNIFPRLVQIFIFLKQNRQTDCGNTVYKSLTETWR